MRLVRFLQRAFVDGRLWEAGEEGLISDAHALGRHMMDLTTGETGDAGEAGVDTHIQRLSHPEREPAAEQPVSEEPAPETPADG